MYESSLPHLLVSYATEHVLYFVPAQPEPFRIHGLSKNLQPIVSSAVSSINQYYVICKWHTLWHLPLDMAH